MTDSIRDTQLFVVSDMGVEAYSFLPYDQTQCGNLPRQGSGVHLRSHAFGNQSRVEFLERTRFDGSDGGGTLKQILRS